MDTISFEQILILILFILPPLLNFMLQRVRRRAAGIRRGGERVQCSNTNATSKSNPRPNRNDKK